MPCRGERRLTNTIISFAVVAAVTVWAMSRWTVLYYRRRNALSWPVAPLRVVDVSEGRPGRGWRRRRAGLRFYGRYEVDGREYGAATLIMDGFAAAQGDRYVAHVAREGVLEMDIQHHPTLHHRHVILPARRHRLPWRYLLVLLLTLVYVLLLA